MNRPTRCAGLDPRIDIKRIRVVNRGLFTFLQPQVQWGWAVYVDGEPHGDPVLRLKDARSRAKRIKLEPEGGSGKP